MKRLSLLFFVLALTIPGSAFAAGMGVMVVGKCSNDIPIASSIQVDVMQASMAAAILKMELSVVKAIGAQTAALQGADTSTAGYLAKMNAQAAHADIINRGLEKNRETITAGIGTNGICPDDTAGSMAIASAAIVNAGKRMFAEQDRNTAQGFFTNSKSGKPEKPKDSLQIETWRAQQAQAVEQYGQFFTQDPVFTPEQTGAWRQFTDLAMPPMKGPRGQFSMAQDSARYKILETRMRETRTILTEAFRQFGADRYATIPAGPVYTWAGSTVPRPSLTMPVVSEDGSINPRYEPVPIPEDGTISRANLLDIISKRYLSEDFFTKLDTLNETGVLKEQFRLEGFKFMVLLDIRNDLRHGNLLKSIELIPVLQAMQNEQQAMLGTADVQ